MESIDVSSSSSEALLVETSSLVNSSTTSATTSAGQRKGGKGRGRKVKKNIVFTHLPYLTNKAGVWVF